MKLQPIAWITGSLNRQLSIAMITVLTIASVICLILFMGIYNEQLAQERSAASVAVNLLLQTSLENAMLKQDLDGLRDIVKKLGQQPEIRLVTIINPQQEIRFSSDPSLLGTKLDNELLPINATTQFINQQGQHILRSINPVYNKYPCTRCHGSIASSPINGVLFIDYNADPIRDKARHNALLFIEAGIFVIGLSLLMLWWFINRLVLKPVQQLANASKTLSHGLLTARVSDIGNNELGLLAQQFNKMVTNLQNSIRDISEQEVFLQALIDAVPDGLRVIGQDYKVLKVNQAFCHQLGLSQDVVLNQTCYKSGYNRTKPCPLTMITCPLHEIGKNSQPIKTITEHVRADGSHITVEVFAAPMEVKIAGKLVKLIVESVRDVNQTIKFSHEQKLATMGEVASGMAHEIYNPLSSVRLALQSTIRTLEAGNTDNVLAYLKLVDGEIDKCIDISQRLLKLGTPSHGKKQLVAIHQAISDTMSLLKFESEQHKIQIELKLELVEDRILGRENDIRMVVFNLAKNAFNAMLNGGKLTIHTWQDSRQIYIEFADTGCGILPQNLSLIFNPFFSKRADHKTGTGLGLSICKTLIANHGGRIEVTSECGQGCIFTVILPGNG